MKLVDLSTPIIHNGVSDPPEQRANILYIDHAAGVESLLASFPGAVAADLPSGTGWAIEMLSLSTHTGTHMDAPWYYGPTSEGTVALSIDQIPLECCFSNGVCFDFSDRADGTRLENDDFSTALEKMEYTLKPRDIVLVQSGAGPWFNKNEYMDKGVGVGREATLWLISQGVRVVGTDAWSWDRPFSFTGKNTHLQKMPRLFGRGISPYRTWILPDGENGKSG